MVLSYLCILLPLILIGFMIYNHPLKANREQAEQLNQCLIQIVKNEFDHHMW